MRRRLLWVIVEIIIRNRPLPEMGLELVVWRPDNRDHPRCGSTGPRYYAPPPAYDEPEPIYATPACYWTRGATVWDDDRGIWMRPRVQVCN